MTRSTADGSPESRWPRRSGSTLAACGGGNIENAPAPSGGGGAAAECGKFNMAINPWVGYEASAHVVGYVAKTKLGCDVEYKNVKEEVAWQGMGNGEVDVVIENWGHPDLKQKYIDRAEDRPGRRPDRQHRASSAGTCRRGWPSSTRTSPTGTT